MFNLIARNLREVPLTKQYENVEATADGVRIVTGNRYGNGNDIVICVSDMGDKLIITDEGRTYYYLQEIFEMGEKDVQKNIIAVLNEHKIKTNEKNLMLEINLSEEPIEEYMLMYFIAMGIECMFSAINFLEAKKLFYV